jgi:hypothetical protein
VAAAGSGGEPMSRWLRNKGCVLCHLPATKVVLQTIRGKLSLPPLAQVHGDLPCAVASALYRRMGKKGSVLQRVL